MTTHNRRSRSRLAARTRTIGLALFCALALSAAAAHARLARSAVNYRPRPVARAAVGTAAVVGTAVVVGSVVRSLPPSCSSVMVDDVAYQQCGSSWYQPHYAGSEVTYVVVDPPE